MTIVADLYPHVVGIDTHARTHTYAVLHHGRLLDTATFPTHQAGLARAVDWDMIPRNPARNVARPPRRRRREPTPWTAEQAAAFPPSPTPPPTAPSGGSCSTPAVASARHSPSAGTTWTSTPAPFASAAP